MTACVKACDSVCMYVRIRESVLYSPSVPGFTGIDAVYEPPENPDLVLKAGEDSVDACVHSVLKLLQQHVRVMWGHVTAMWSCESHVTCSHSCGGRVTGMWSCEGHVTCSHTSSKACSSASARYVRSCVAKQIDIR